MKRQCECPAQADEIVFGSLHECSQDPSMTSPTRKKSWVDHANFNEPVLRDRWDMDDDERRG